MTERDKIGQLIADLQGALAAAKRLESLLEPLHHVRAGREQRVSVNGYAQPITFSNEAVETALMREVDAVRVSITSNIDLALLNVPTIADVVKAADDADIPF